MSGPDRSRAGLRPITPLTICKSYFHCEALYLTRDENRRGVRPVVVNPAQDIQVLQSECCAKPPGNAKSTVSSLTKNHLRSQNESQWVDAK